MAHRNQLVQFILRCRSGPVPREPCFGTSRGMSSAARAFEFTRSSRRSPPQDETSRMSIRKERARLLSDIRRTSLSES